MELFAIICLALIMITVIVFNTWKWSQTKMSDGGQIGFSLIITTICACVVIFLGYWLIVWGGQYFINMGWCYFDQTIAE